MSDPRERSWVDSKHYRETSSDGRQSYLYEAGGLLSPSILVEIADHHPDGTTTAYEPGGIIDTLFGDGKGQKK